MKAKVGFELDLTRSLNGLIDFPPMHITFGTTEDGVLAAHCLDFDIWAFSEQEDPTVAAEHAVSRLLEMTVLRIFSLFTEGRLGHLYENRVTDQVEWAEYQELVSAFRVAQLEDSLQLALKNPEKLNQRSDIAEFDMSQLTDAEKTEASSWMEELIACDPDRRKEILWKMVRSRDRNVVPLDLFRDSKAS